MSPELREKLENLVFSAQNPHLSLDARLQPFLDLLAECEQEAIAAERERIVSVLLAEHSARGVWAARIIRESP